MRTIRMTGLVDEEKKLLLTLPPDTRSGAVEVIVLVDGMEEAGGTRPIDDSFTELMEFHKGRRLDGISLKELVTEGRR